MTAVATITEAELRYGVAKNPNAIRRRASVESFFSEISILRWNSAAAGRHGHLRAVQEPKGRRLSVEDLMVAAHALSLGLALVTQVSAFAFVDGLKREDWTIA